MAEFILPPDEGEDQQKAVAPLTGTGFVMPQDPNPVTLVNARDAASGNPEEYAKAKKIAERLSMPLPVVQSDLKSYDTEQKVVEAQARMARDPFYAQQMRDPNFAKLSSGDEGILGAVKDVVTFPWKTTQAAAGGLYQLSSGIYGVGAAAAELGSEYITKPLTGAILPEDIFGKIGAKLRAASVSTREYGKRVTDLPPDAGLVRTAIASGFESLGQNLPLMIAALYTGNVALALSVMSASSGGQSYTKAREAGLSVAKATQYGLTDAGFEYLTEMFPLTKLIGEMKAGTPFIKAFMQNQVREQLGEQAATVLQDFNEWVTLHPEQPFSAYLEARPVAALQTAIATAIGSGGQVALLHVAAKAADIQVESANKDAAALAALLEHSEKSELLKRDIPTFTQFVNAAAAQGPVDAVYIDAATFAQAAQQAGIDLKATMPETAAALDEAVTTKSDVRIPLGEFAANSTLFQPEIVKHLKTDPHGATQAQTADAEWVKETQAATEKALAQHEFTSAIKQSGETVKAELKAQLAAANRFTPEVNDAYAGFMAAFYTTQAARLGITPEQMYVKYPLRIQAQNFEGVNVLTQPTSGSRINVGRSIGTAENAVDADELVKAVEALGVKVTHEEFQSDTSSKELTSIITTDRELTEQEVYALSAQFGQRAIAHLNLATGEGALWGPDRQGWIDEYGDFNPEYFYNEPGRTLAESRALVKVLEQAARGPLLAPNGKVSRLSPAQYALVRTPRFKKWFGDWEKFATEKSGVWADDKKAVSKVVDDNGEPLVVYHGTPAGGFTEFSQDASKKEKATFFTDDPRTARTYSGTLNEIDLSELDEDGNAPEQRGLYPVFLNIRDPNETSFEGANWDGSRHEQYQVFESEDEDAEPVYDESGKGFFSKDEAETLAGSGGFVRQAFDHYDTTDGVVAEAIRLKNDGAIIRDVTDPGPFSRGGEDVTNIYAVFSPEQIKSIENAGTFDPNNPNILMQGGVKNTTPAISRPLKNLTPYERQKVTDGLAARIVEQLEKLPAADEMAAVAWAGRAKRGWYEESARAISEIFGWDAPHFAALLAALSPQTSVEINLGNALRTWKNWDAAGRPRDRATIIKILGESVEGGGTEASVLNAWINNSVHALQDIDTLTSRPLSGGKVNSFYLNLLGNVNEVTLDAWMANYALIDQGLFQPSGTQKAKLKAAVVTTRDPGKSGAYLAYASRVREAAARLSKLTGETWTPAEVQETVWSWAKTLYEHANREGEARTAQQIVLDDALTNELLTSTPDFANLFHDPKYASILQDAGYGQQLEELATSRRDNERDAGQDDEPGTAGEATPFDRATQKRHEARAAKRLDKLAEAGGKKALFAQQGLGTARLPEHGAPVPGSISVVGVHYSTEQRAFLSSGAYGRGAKGAERAHVEASGDPRLAQRIHFYVNQGAGVRPEPGVGVVAHAVRLNGLYDASADRLGLFKGRAPAEAESAVLDSGFAGYYSRNFGDQGAAVLLGAQTVPVQPVDPATIREVPPPADLTPERELAEALVAVPGLPGGQMSGPDWINMIWKAAPQIASQIPETALAALEAHTDLMYRDEVARTFYQVTPEIAKHIAGSAVQQVVYHGTTADFTTFDSSRANVESDLGAGFYFTDAREDVANNYAGFGPDLTQKIEQRAEQIISDKDLSYGSVEYKRALAAAKRKAKKEFGVVHGGATIPVYLSLKNPFVIGGAKNTFLDYEAKQDADGEYTGDKTGLLVDFIVALRDVAAQYGEGHIDGVVSKLVEKGGGDGGVNAADLIDIVKEDEDFSYFTDGSGRLVNNEIVRQALEAVGFDGIIDHTVNKKFGSEANFGKMAGMTVGTTHYVVFDHKQIMSAISGQMMQGEVKPRGQISFGSDLKATPSVLTLLANADLSTFLHESGHFYLEVLRDMAGQPDAPPEVVADFAKTLAWFGLKDVAQWDAMTLEEKRPHHEQFARGFESYLFEGKAPSETLQPLFQRFRSWMINVYRQLTSLDVSLTDEVRGVFDRLVATNEEILQAETARTFAPLYETKPDGMTEAEWGDYHTLGGEATQEAVDQLQTRSLRDMQYASNAKTAALKRLQQRAKLLRKGVRAEVAAEVSAEPIYQAMRFLKTGVYEGESAGTYTRHRLDIASLDAMYPEDMPDRPPLLNLAQMRGYDGIAPDVVARMFGYGSGDVFVRELLNTEPMQQKIDGITDQRMLERYGDLADQASMEKAANAAVHNEVRAKFIATELRTLDKAAGNKVTLAAMAREFAATLIARKKIRTIRPAIYAAAAAKAAKNADTAFRKDDVATAAGEKRNQLVNTYASRFANDALDEVEQSVAYLKRVGESKAIDPEYRTQINALLERFDLRKVSGPEAARRQSLVQWMEAQREKGFEPAIDPALENEALRQPHQEMTLEEFRGLVDSIKNIEHLGRLKHKLLVLQDKREFALVVESVRQSIEANAKRTIPHRTEAEMSARKQILAFHTKMSSFMRQLDGWQDNGIMQRLFVHSSNAAGAREAGLHEQATVQLIALFQPLLKNETAAQKAGRAVTPFGIYSGYMGEKLFIPEINESLSREARIMIALNTGNEGNLQRLMDGDRWTDKQVQAVVDTLTKQEMDFVQSVWDFIATYRPVVGAQQKRLTGVEPTWVEPRRVITKWGEYAGGYLPAKYNGAMSSRSLSDEAAANLTDALRATRGSAAARASFTKERAAKVINRPLRKDFGVITQHLTEVTHRLAWQEWLVDANRILRASAVDGAIREHYGPEMLESIRENITAIAAGNVGPQNALERGVNYLRTGATIAGLGWRLTTSLLQPFGLTQSMMRIGPKWIGKGLAEFLGDAAHMENAMTKISAKSEMMRLRAKTMQREISEIQDTVKGEGGAIKGSFFYLIQKMQLVADIPTWLGQYQKALATSGIEDPAALEANAIAQADQAVLDAQGSGQVKDLPAVLRGSPYLKLWTNFASFFIGTTFQLTREAVGRTKFDSPGSVLMLAADFVLLYSLPAALGTLMKYALSDEDDEDKLIRELLADQLSFMLGTMIGLRELGSLGRGLTGLPGDYSGPAGGRILGEITRLGKQVHQGEADEAFWKALNSAAGVIFHYPAGQINATADGIVTMADGKTTNPGVLAVGSSKK